MAEDLVQIEIPDLGNPSKPEQLEPKPQLNTSLARSGSVRNSEEKPAEYALHILFTQFVRHTERKLNDLTTEDSPGLVESIFGKGVDKEFDKILTSLGHVARRKPKPVIDSVMYWRKSKSDQAAFLAQSGNVPSQEIMLAERKSLVSIFVLSRVLMEVVKEAPVEILGNELYEKLEEIVFKQLHSADPALIARSPVRRANWQLLSRLLGDMSENHFVSVEDRFICELEKVPKTLNAQQEARISMLIEAMEHLKLSLYPEECMEESANFLESIYKFFSQSDSLKIREKYAYVLARMFEPLAEVATAEVNHPLWAKYIEMIYNLCISVSKQTWNLGLEAAVMSLCVSPQQNVVAHMMPLIEGQFPSKQKIQKWNTRYNSIYHFASKLTWVYCFRCQESFNNTTRKIEALKNSVFSIPKKFWGMLDHEALMAAISMLTSLFATYQQYTLDEVLFPLLTGNNATHMTKYRQVSYESIVPERAIVAVHAFARCINYLQTKATPEFPTRKLLETGTLNVPYVHIPKTSMQNVTASLIESIDLFGGSLGQLLLVLCNQLELQQETEVTPTRQNSVAYLVGLATNNNGSHGSTTVSADLVLAIIQSMPFWAGKSVKYWDTLCRQVGNINPQISKASAYALRSLAQTCDLKTLINVYSKYMFAMDAKTYMKKAETNLDRVLRTYIDLIELWVKRLQSGDPGFAPESSRDMTLSTLWSTVEEIEGNGLFFLCSQARDIRALALRVLWLSTELDKAIAAYSRISARQQQANKSDGNMSFGYEESEQKSGSQTSDRLIHFLENAEIPELIKRSNNPLELSMPERTRVSKFKTKKGASIARLADSDYGVDSAIWLKLLPAVISLCFEKYPMPMAICRTIVCARLVQMHDMITEIIDTEMPNEKDAKFTGNFMATKARIVIAQWRIYLTVACTTLTTTEEQKLFVPNVEPSSNQFTHNRKKSSSQKITLHHQRITSALSIFRIFLPLLGVNNLPVCEAIIAGISCININTYQSLLECLQPVISKWTPVFRNRTGNMIAAQRIITNCTKILKLTTHFLKQDSVKSSEWARSELGSILDMLYDILSTGTTQQEECKQLTRYFCDLIVDCYNGLESRLWSVDQCRKYWKLIEQWSSYGQYASVAADREAMMRRYALSQAKGMQENIILASMEFERRKTDFSVNRAMATLLTWPIAPADWPSMLKWVYSLLSTSQEPFHEVGRLALSKFLLHNATSPVLVKEIVFQSYHSNISNKSVGKHYFLSLVDAYEDNAGLEMVDPHELLALGIFEVGGSEFLVRQRALDLISLVEQRMFKRTTFTSFLCALSSNSSSVYKGEVFHVSGKLAAAWPKETFKLASCMTKAFHDVRDMDRRDILSALLPWLQNVDFKDREKDEDRASLMLLCNMFELTVLFSDRIQHEMEALWVALCTGPSGPKNVDVVLDFLFNICLISRSLGVITFARRIILFLSRSVAAPIIVDRLLGYLEPRWMISQTLKPLEIDEAKSSFPYVGDPTNFSGAAERALNLPPTGSEHLPPLSYGHLSVVFLVDATENKEILRPHLANVFHIAMVLSDYFVPIVQEKASQLSQSLLGLFVPKDRLEMRSFLKKLAHYRWRYDDMNLTSRTAGNITTPENMVKLINEIVTHVPDIQYKWSTEAVKWATTCPVRHIACRSFQIFRCVLTDVNKPMIADMLARLSTTVSEDASDIQGFSIQILMTLNAIVDKMDAITLHKFPQLFWATVATLGTTREREYIESLSILSKILDKWQWDSIDAVEFLRSSFPPRWEGEFQGVQQLVLLGLRSANTFEISLNLLDKLNNTTPNDILFDEHHLALTYAAFLPSFLHATEVNDISTVAKYSETLENLSTSQGLTPLSRILHSFTMGRFWSKQDFLSQYINTLNQLFPESVTPAFIMLMGTLSNKLDWVKVETMAILKLLLPHVDLNTDDRLRGLGADIVSPLLRLLQTDFVEQALGVLDQASAIVGGQMDKHILRMSLGSRQLVKEYERTATLFGIPEDSGWSVSKPAITATIARNNVHAVFYTCTDSTVSTDLKEPSEDVIKLEFQGEEGAYEYHNPAMLTRMDSVSTNPEPEGLRSMDRMLTVLDDLDSFFTTQNNGEMNGRRKHHYHQYSVSSSIMGPSHTQMHSNHYMPHSRKPSGITENSITESFTDRNENIPQLYDKKVSLILNHSLGPDPSNVSFRTSFAETFGHQHHMGTGSTDLRPRRVGNILEFDEFEEDPIPGASTSMSTHSTIIDTDSDNSMKSPVKNKESFDSSFRLESLLRGKRRSKKAEKKQEKEREARKKTAKSSSFQFP